MSRSKDARWATWVMAVGMLMLPHLAGCRHNPAPPPPTPEKLSAQERILQVADGWREWSQTEGYPNLPDVAFLRVNDAFTLQLSKQANSALVDIERRELMRSPDGREFHCVVKGAVRASVHFDWRADEAAVEVRMPAASLPRSCEEPGFSRPFKSFPAIIATYVLRGDQLVAVEPRTLRSVLLPVQ